MDKIYTTLIEKAKKSYGNMGKTEFFITSFEFRGDTYYTYSECKTESNIEHWQMLNGKWKKEVIASEV